MLVGWGPANGGIPIITESILGTEVETIGATEAIKAGGTIEGAADGTEVVIVATDNIGWVGMVAKIVGLKPHSLIDEEGPTTVVKGQAIATDDLKVAVEVIGHAEEIITLLFAEPEVTIGQEIDENDELMLVRVAEAGYLKLADIEANWQAEPLDAITLLLVTAVVALHNNGQIIAELVLSVGFEMIFLATLEVNSHKDCTDDDPDEILNEEGPAEAIVEEVNVTEKWWMDELEVDSETLDNLLELDE